MCISWLILRLVSISFQDTGLHFFSIFFLLLTLRNLTVIQPKACLISYLEWTHQFYIMKRSECCKSLKILNDNTIRCKEKKDLHLKHTIGNVQCYEHYRDKFDQMLIQMKQHKWERVSDHILQFIWYKFQRARNNSSIAWDYKKNLQTI